MVRKLTIGLMMASLLSWANAAQAEQPMTVPNDVASSLISDDYGKGFERAPVLLDGEVVFSVSGIRSFPAPIRAESVAKRLRAAAEDPSFSAESLKSEIGTDRTELKYGDKILVGVYDLDAESEGIPRAVLAEVVRSRILASVAKYRRERSPDVLSQRAGVAVAAVFLFLGLLLALRWGFSWLRRRVVQKMKQGLDGLEAKSHQLLQSRQLGSFLDGLINTCQWLTVILVTVVFVDFVLQLFPWTRPAARTFVALLVGPLETLGRGFLQMLPNLIFLTVLFFVVRYVLKLVRVFFAGVDGGTIELASFNREWAWPTYRLVRIAIVALALVVGYPYIPGSGSEAFKGISIFLGVIFSIGSSSFISNIIAGYTMIYRRAFQVGDRIAIADQIGIVSEIGLQVTRLHSPKNEEIILPNSQVLSSHLTNYSSLARKGGLILHTTVGIGYETPWRQVEAMLLNAAARTEGLLREPRPFVLQKALGDFAVTYELNAYCDKPEAILQLYSEMHANILDVFNEYGVQIMTPAYEGDPAQPKVVAKTDWFAPPALPETSARRRESR